MRSSAYAHDTGYPAKEAVAPLSQHTGCKMAEIGDPETIHVRETELAAEVAWFAGLRNDDYEFLGVSDGALRSSFYHRAEMVCATDRLGD